MRSLVGPLLLGLGPWLAMGCASTNLNLHKLESFALRSKDRSSRDDGDFAGKLRFKTPKRQSKTEKDVAESALAEFDQSLNRSQKSGRDSTESLNGPTQQRLTDSRKDIQQTSDQSINADDRNLVQLQGLEVVDTGTTSRELTSTSSDRDQEFEITITDHEQGSKQATGRAESHDRDNSGWPRNNNSVNPVNATMAGSAGDSTVTADKSVAAMTSSSSKASAILPPLPWQADLEQLILRAEKLVAMSRPDGTPDQQAEYLRRHAQLRMLYLMAQRQEDALTAIPSLPAPQQEYWQQMVWALSNSFDTVQFPESGERAGQSIAPLSAALRQLREDASLSIKNMTFCRKISKFGAYEPFQRNEFTPGQEVLLYTEIENFLSAPTADGDYRTLLKSQLEIVDANDKVAWSEPFPPTEDRCRNPRRDYFHNYQFRMPDDIPTGSYRLRLTISDELGQKRVTNMLTFTLK